MDTSLVVLCETTWIDENGDKAVVNIPIGTTLVRADPTHEVKYREFSHRVKELCAEVDVWPCESDYDKNMLTQKVGTMQKLWKAVDNYRTEGYKKRLDELGRHIQTIFKTGLLDPLDTSKKAANSRIDAFDAKLRAVLAKELKAQQEAEKQRLENELDPEATPPPPAPWMTTKPLRTVTESGTRFSKKTWRWELTDYLLLPAEYTIQVPDERKLDDKAEELAEPILADTEITDAVPGIKFIVQWKGSVRS